MEAVRSHLRVLGSTAIVMLAAVVVLGGSAVGLLLLAEYLRDTWLVGRLVAMIGFYLAAGGALVVTLLLPIGVLGPNLATKLFFVRNKVLTPDVVRDLVATEAAAVTVPIASGQGVLRVIPFKPEWWLDDSYADDAAPVVAVEDVEYGLPGWGPYDIAVPAGSVDVVVWVPRRNGNLGRRVRNSIPVPEGRVGALIFRPSSIPELPGTVESLSSELTGTLSMFRLSLAAAVLIGFAYTAWRLITG
ncbi:hypothetical protein ACFY2Q_28010 [Micromonospora sp. NPDC000316]|uniref:hypothetical protein n=1 Tax=Micromonospora sp. NPDC000316 TaxID=3364216 RepID=UPI0036A59018